MFDYTRTHDAEWQPLDLLNADFAHDAGYRPNDCNFLSAQLAASTHSGLVSSDALIDAFEQDHFPDSVPEPFQHRALITSEVAVEPMAGDMSRALRVGFYLRDLYLRQPQLDWPSKIMVPITLKRTLQGADHAALMVIDWDKANQQFHVSMFEQHRLHDHSELDFNGECMLLVHSMANAMNAVHHQNHAPFCRLRRVCGIARQEAMKTMLMSDQPGYHFAAQPDLLALDDAAVQAAHRTNLRLAQRTAQPCAASTEPAKRPPSEMDLAPFIRRLLRGDEGVMREIRAAGTPLNDATPWR